MAHIRPSNVGEVAENLDAFRFRPVVSIVEVSPHITRGRGIDVQKVMCGRGGTASKDVDSVRETKMKAVKTVCGRWRRKQ
jgi:hypothetical protein